MCYFLYLWKPLKIVTINWYGVISRKVFENFFRSRRKKGDQQHETVSYSAFYIDCREQKKERNYMEYYIKRMFYFYMNMIQRCLHPVSIFVLWFDSNRKKGDRV